MADAKLTALSAIGTLGTDDLFYVVDDPGGTPLSRKATGAVVKAFILNTGATDNAALRADGTGGALLQNSSLIINDNSGTQYDVSVDASVSHGINNSSTGASASAGFRFVNGTNADILLSGSHNQSSVFLSALSGILIVQTASGNTFPIIYRVNGTDVASMNNGGLVMIGGATADRQLHVETDDATTNAVTYNQRLTHTTSGTAAANIGVGTEYEVETLGGNKVGATLEVFASDASSGTEDFKVRVKTMSAGQAVATALDIGLPGTVYPQGQIFGLTMSNDAGDTTNDINITAGEATDETGTWLMTRATEMTKRIDATWVVGDDQGGMANNGTGVADNTWYEVLLIGREDTRVVDVAFSTTANRAVLPTNYTHKRRIGWVRRGSSTNLQFTQVDDYVTWTTQVNDSSTTVTATASAITLTAPPSSIARFRATLQVTALAQAAEIVTVFSEIPEGNVTPAGSTGIASLGSNGQSATSASNDWTAAGHFELRVSSTSTIEHDSALGTGGAGTFDISTYGFIDHRRRLCAT